MSAPKHRLGSEAQTRRIYAIERVHDGRVLEVFCTRAGAALYRNSQIKEGHWTRKGTRIVPGWFTPGTEKPAHV